MSCNNMPTTHPNNFSDQPQYHNDYFDISDSEDCESVQSNSPKHEDVIDTDKNPKNDRIEKTTLESSTHRSSLKQNSSKIHVETKNLQKESTKTRLQGKQHGPTSIPILKNTSSSVTPCKTNLDGLNKTNYVKSEEHLDMGGIENNLHGHRQDTSNKVSKTHNINHSPTHSSTSIKKFLTMQNIEAKKCKNQNTKKLDDYITMDEGDGGGFSNKINDLNMHKHMNDTHLIQDQDEEEQEPFDEGDGGGSGSRSQVISKRKHKSHGNHARHGTPHGSRSSGGSSRSRGSSRKSGESNQSRRSRSGSQEKNRHCRSKERENERKSRGGSHQGNRTSSQSSSHSSDRPWMDDCGLTVFNDTKPHPAKWRCFGRRPPAIHEFRPMGETRVKNVRPAGKPGYRARNADEKLGCRGPDASDTWDICYGLTKPITDQRSTPVAYGKNAQIGDIDPYFFPSRGDIVIINPAQNFYRAMKTGFVMIYSGRGYSFGVGDLIVHLGRFLPNGDYIPYGNLELYMHTQTREMRLLGFQPPLLVDFNYHNLDYESPGKYLDIGTFLNESFFPRRGDIIIRGGTWAQNYPNIQRKHHSSVKYWRPRMEFLPNDMLLRPYIDIGSKSDPRGGNFYWGVVELYTYSGKGLAWAYWGRDHHIYDTPPPCEKKHGIKIGHKKDGIGQTGDSIYGDGYSPHGSHGHQPAHGCRREHKVSSRHHRQGHHARRASPCT